MTKSRNIRGNTTPRRLRPSSRAKMMWSTAKARAQKKGVPFSISAQWIEQRLLAGSCELTGIPFDLASATVDDRNPWTPTIDRKDPALGYVAGNVRVVCWIYNSAKNTATDGDVLLMAQALCRRSKFVRVPRPTRATALAPGLGAKPPNPNEETLWERLH